MLARFLGNTLTAVADSVNITYSTALGRIVEYAIVAFVVVLAISTLGVDTTILTSSLTIIIASAGLAIALTFGLGSRESARTVIAGFYVRQNFHPGQRVTLGEYRGTVRSISGTYTVLDTVNENGERGTVSLPNLMLMQNAVRATNP
jgi:small-conductance mechanosensitive channel